MKPDKANVLLVDHKPENHYTLALLLKSLDLEVAQVLCGNGSTTSNAAT